MTGDTPLYLIAIGLVVLGWSTRASAEGDVTIYAPLPTVKSRALGATLDGLPVIHKSLHKGKSKNVVANAVATPAATVIAASPLTKPPVSRAPVAAPAPVPVIQLPINPASVPGFVSQGDVTLPSAPLPPTALPDPPGSSLPVAITTAPAKTPATAIPSQVGAMLPGNVPSIAASVPAVETELPVARHSGTDVATGFPAPSVNYDNPATSYRTMIASTIPPLSPVVPVQSSETPTYLPPGKTTSGADTFPFANFKKTRTYPWKKDIITTEFWIGEGGSTISPTDNVSSAWDADWRINNHGTDNPNDRDSYVPADHAPTLNPFYIALPFNDLAYPDKTRRWLPSGWYRSPREGKQVSACKDRWVEIKNAQGETCYAQWEDVGPLRSDHAEYVFGEERPDTYTRAGLDVSPAVAQYLNINEKNRYTSWRFVDAEDVPPGSWLKYDEQAVLYKAMHELKNSTPNSNLPIQRSIAPPDDPSNIDSNERKVGAAKG